MKSFFSFLFLTFSLIGFSQSHSQSIGFIENKGQIVDQKGLKNNAVKYLLNTPGLNVQLRENGFSYDVYETKKIPLTQKEQKLLLNNSFTKEDSLANENYRFDFSYHRIDIDFVNCNPAVKLISEGKSGDFDNYYNVVSKPDGITNVYKFQKITYQNIYPNIDVVFFVPEDKSIPVEYNFIVKPNGKISDIQLEFKGAKTELIDNKIKMNVRFGKMEETIPMSWTENDKKEVAINYTKISKNIYGFKTNENINGKKVIIDPTPIRLWGTYYGGSNDERAGSIHIDSNNNVIISGGTASSNNIATNGPNTSNYNSGGAFIAKFDTNGNRIWSSYYPFPTSSLELDSYNNMYLFGKVLYPNSQIPSLNCFQPVKDIYTSGYIIKLNSLGAKEWGTYYGGNQNEDLYGLKIDINNNIYLVGSTNSTDVFSTPGAFLEVKPSSTRYYSGFVAKFNSSGDRIWGTYYGGEASDQFLDCSISNDGYLYAVGIHDSQNNIATPGAYQTTFNGNGGMIVKFDLNGNRIWGSFIVDNSYIFNGKLKGDTIFLSGRTSSNGIGTPGTMFETMQPIPTGALLYGVENSFISKFNLQTQQYIWGTYFNQQLHSVDVDSNDNVFISGETATDNGISTQDGYMPIRNFYHKSYLIKLNTLGQKVWGTYYGGNLAEQLGFVKIDHNNDIYLYGNTNGSTTGIATVGAHQTSPGSNPDTYLVKFRDCQSSSQAVSNNPCIGEDLTLTASGGTNYSWTGPNGYTSSQQNPVITNANATHSGQYSCAITGTAGCDNTITIDVIVGDVTKPVPNVLNLPTITGDCTTIIAVPTATDNCSGSLNGTTTNPLNYPLPGTYNFLWSYTDVNGNTETQNQTVVISDVVLPTLTSPQTFCIQQNATINTIVINGLNIKWYDSSTSAVELPSTTLLTNGTTYFATQTVNGCESVNRLPITIGLIYTLNAVDYATTVCDIGNDGSELVDLSQFNANLVTVSGNTFTYFKSYNGAENQIVLEQLATNHTINLGLNTIYVRIDSVNGCHQIVTLQLTLVSVPVITITDEVVLCENRSVTVNAGAGFSSYLWSTGATSASIVITIAGNYSVTVTKNYGGVVCTSTKNFIVVLSNAPIITSINTVDWTDTENSITINLSSTSIGSYEYSIDGINYQTSNIFNGLPNGSYLVHVRDIKECGFDTEQVFLLNYPKYFTPNGDGFHDSWSIKFSQFEPNFEVKIFDRYGKLLRVMKNNEGWDGNYIGRQLPSDDYWFVVTRNDGRTHRGHFSSHQ